MNKTTNSVLAMAARNMLDALDLPIGLAGSSVMVKRAEASMLDALRAANHITTDFAHVEYGCVEYGAVHVFYSNSLDFDAMSFALVVYPADGRVEHF